MIGSQSRPYFFPIYYFYFHLTCFFFFFKLLLPSCHILLFSFHHLPLKATFSFFFLSLTTSWSALLIFFFCFYFGIYLFDLFSLASRICISLSSIYGLVLEVPVSLFLSFVVNAFFVQRFVFGNIKRMK